MQPRSCLRTTPSIDHVTIFLSAAPPAYSPSRKDHLPCFGKRAFIVLLLLVSTTFLRRKYVLRNPLGSLFVSPALQHDPPFYHQLSHLPIFLTAFPRVVQSTLALVLEPEENAQIQLQYAPRVLVSFTSTAPASIEPFTVTVTVTVTNVTPDLVHLVAEKLPNLTHLSFVWYPETDVAHGGVEISRIS